MKKRNKQLLSFFTAFAFMFSLISSVYSNKVQAYSNSRIFSDVRVGLVSMSNTVLTAVLTGSYTLNGVQMPSGTALNLKANNNFVNVNGSDYSELQLIPQSSSSLLTLTSGTSTYKYQGSFLFKVSSGKILPVNSLDLESYLKGVVGYEMSDYFPLEALKAQVVAARNYALTRLGYEASKGYDFDDTILYQVYKGYDDRLKNVLRAVDETKYVLLLHNDRLVETLYSASHGGYSEDAVNVWGNPVVYLKAKADSFDNFPWPNGNLSFTTAQIDSILKSKALLLPEDTFLSLSLESITRYTSGRVSNITIIYQNSTGEVKSKSLTRDRTRSFLSLPSNMYTVSYNMETGFYTFSGMGNGHGLGMSQLGAKYRAASGQTYEQILKFYYDGTYLVNLAPKASLSSFIISSSEVYTNASVEINTSGAGGSGRYLYKYQVIKGGVSILNTEYSENSSLSYKAVQSGSYEIVAYIKDKYSSLGFDGKQSKLFKVVEPYSAPKIASSKSTGKMLINNPVEITSDIKSSNPSGYTSRYTVKLNGRIVAEKSLASSSSFSFTPTTAGKYTVSLDVKDNTSVSNSSANKTFDLYIDNATLKVSRLPIKYKAKGTDVRVIQTGLSQLGYNIGKVDGVFGTKTLNAIKSFQKTSKLKVTGTVDTATFNAINSALVKKANVKTISY
jgi:stage II sporulation protein D